MKTRKLEDVVKHIRAILDQNQNPEDLVSVEDLKTLSIESLIENYIEEAVSIAVMNADEEMFEYVDRREYKDSERYPTAELKVDGGVIAIGEDVQRVLQISSDSWNGVVKDLVDKDSTLYRMCNNRHLNCIGVKDRPIAFKFFNGTGRRVKVYPAPEDSVVLTYIEKSRITLNEANQKIISIDDMLYEGVCLYDAYLVAMTCGWPTTDRYKREAYDSLQIMTNTTETTEAQS